MEEAIEKLSPADVVGLLATVPLVPQAQEMMRLLAYRAAEQRLLEHYASTAERQIRRQLIASLDVRRRNFGSVISADAVSNTTSTGMPMRISSTRAVDEVRDHLRALGELHDHDGVRHLGRRRRGGRSGASR